MTALGAARLVNPLLRLLRARHIDPDFIPEPLRAADHDERVPIELLHGAIESAADLLGEKYLGIELGTHFCLGELGPLDYLLRSAPTVREALEDAGRYAALQADGYRIFLEPRRGGGLLRLVDETSWPTTVADMAMSSAYTLHVGKRTPFTSQLECWFPYGTPRDPGTHVRCFPGAKLRFNAPFHAFAIDDSYERAPQPGADPQLHEILRNHLDGVVHDMTRTAGLRARVRRTIERQLREHGDASVPVIARSLSMSRRTLSRRLQQEGTTFAEELDAVRSTLALSLVANSSRPLAEVAFMLGFSHVESFHRAFKRWTGTTPLAHRSQSVAVSSGPEAGH
ncbi:MAG: AraC family transcriptional regulator ligand-binding domain-containing protein [Myxococcales bacterium]|nr:AraC family transcriptional regulator ligand-binding domain-containing protein [Myxococcales bacterium]